MLMANDCQQLVCEICGHEYKMWCKKDKIDQAQEIIEKIKPLIIKTTAKHQVLSFDKILFMSLVEILAKDKDYSSPKETIKNQIHDKNEFEIELEKQKTQLTNDFINILSQIYNALDE